MTRLVDLVHVIIDVVDGRSYGAAFNNRSVGRLVMSSRSHHRKSLVVAAYDILITPCSEKWVLAIADKRFLVIAINAAADILTVVIFAWISLISYVVADMVFAKFAKVSRAAFAKVSFVVGSNQIVTVSVDVCVYSKCSNA